MADYKKIVEEAFRKANESKGIIPTSVNPKNKLNENILYPEGLTERMHPKLEDDLLNKKTSLGKHPIFPDGDENSFEEKIMGKRFHDVVNRYKSAHGVDNINPNDVMMTLMPLVNKGMELEKSHKKELEDLAIKMIRDEFDIGEDVVDIDAKLTPYIDLEGTKINPSPISNYMDFKNHDEMVNATDEVYKRRFVNAMIQGAAKKSTHMFHMVNDELAELDPKLSNLYSKMMSSADFMYYIVPKMENGINGGVVRVEFPTKNNPKIIIKAQAMVFPVLIHELVKGVMEVLSARGLPKQKLGKYVIDKADFLSAEPWDMRIGPALWTKFVEMIEPDDFKLKHHIWNELVALPVKEFNKKMKEIMAGTKEGKKIITDIVDDVKNEIKNDDFDETINNIDAEMNDNTDTYDLEELMGTDNFDSDDEINYDELFE